MHASLHVVLTAWFWDPLGVVGECLAGIRICTQLLQGIREVLGVHNLSSQTSRLPGSDMCFFYEVGFF
jgi:hypothetical protein